MLKGASRAVLKILEEELHEAWRSGYREGKSEGRSPCCACDPLGPLRPGGRGDRCDREVRPSRSARGDRRTRRHLPGSRRLPRGHPVGDVVGDAEAEEMKRRSGSPRPRSREASPGSTYDARSPGPLRVDNGPRSLHDPRARAIPPATIETTANDPGPARPTDGAANHDGRPTGSRTDAAAAPARDVAGRREPRRMGLNSYRSSPHPRRRGSRAADRRRAAPSSGSWGGTGRRCT